MLYTIKTKNMKMKKIKEMVESAFTKKQAMDMLETYHIFSNITEDEYKKGKAMIRKEFN